MKHLDENGLLYFWTKIKAYFVKAEAGKGLSTNDFTTAEKNKLATVAQNANANLIESIKVNGTAQTITAKAVDIKVPTKVSELSNDADYQTGTQVTATVNAALTDYATTSEVENKLKSYVSTDKHTTDLSTKVDKVDGKGLSTNDFTTAEKNKLAGLSNYSLPTASAEQLGGVKVGSGLTINNGVLSATGEGTVADAVEWKNVLNKPTKVSAFENDAGYQTSAQVESAITAKGYQTATQVNSAITAKGYQTADQVNTAIAEAIADVTQFGYEVVKSLPATGTKGVIYLVSNSGTSPNIYDEYIYVDNKFEKIGTTEIDLSGYVKTTDLVAITNEEIDSIMAN